MSEKTIEIALTLANKGQYFGSRLSILPYRAEKRTQDDPTYEIKSNLGTVIAYAPSLFAAARITAQLG
jgi:hypothetical protein